MHIGFFPPPWLRCFIWDLFERSYFTVGQNYTIFRVLCAHSVKIPKVTFHSSIQISLSVSALFHCHFLHGIDRLGVCMLVIIARSEMRSIWHFVFLTLLALISVAGWEGKSTDIMASISQLCSSSSSIGRCSALGANSMLTMIHLLILVRSSFLREWLPPHSMPWCSSINILY